MGWFDNLQGKNRQEIQEEVKVHLQPDPRCEEAYKLLLSGWRNSSHSYAADSAYVDLVIKLVIAECSATMLQ